MNIPVFYKWLKKKEIKKIEQEIELGDCSDSEEIKKIEQEIKKIEQEIDTEDWSDGGESYLAASSEDDDKPLSVLSKQLKFRSNFSNLEQNSSGSEYKFSEYEKNKLKDSYLESSSSDSDILSLKKKTKRRSKKQRNMKGTSAESDNVSFFNNLDHNYSFEVENMNIADTVVDEVTVPFEEYLTDILRMLMTLKCKTIRLEVKMSLTLPQR